MIMNNPLAVNQPTPVPSKEGSLKARTSLPFPSSEGLGVGSGRVATREIHLLGLRTTFRAAVACAVLVASALLVGAEEKGVERVVLVGDSTVASKSGWGDAFAKLLTSGVECTNMGRGGRSSKSYRDEGHWQKVLDLKPTWVLIQFGHNDQPGKGPTRETDPKTTFRENLARYVSEARAIGAKPVLVTSLTRRNFNAEGKIVSGQLEPMADAAGEKKPDYLNGYAEGARAVAAEQKVPLIDLNARSIEQMNQLGPKAAVAFDAESKDPTKPDRTHLSAKGAEETARLVAAEVRKNAPELAKLLTP
jgi:lysophospholipase L1-like esterase